MSYSHITPGKEIEYCSHAYSSDGKGIEELVKYSLSELIQMAADSEKKERAVYTELCDVGSKWRDIAIETNRIRNAMEYIKTLPVTHTSNQVKKGEYDWYEISNMVYKFRWRVYEQTSYKFGKDKIIAWELSWTLHYNTPTGPDYSGSGWKIAGQDRKRFTDKAAMEKYLDGRIKAYAHLFVEISPPIPQVEVGRFSVNGCLLPGYKVDSPELTKPNQEEIDDLLSLLEEEDAPPPPSPLIVQKGDKIKPHKPKKRPGISR